MEHWLCNAVPSANGLVCGSCWWMCPSHQGTQALLRQVLAGFPSMQPDPLAHPYALARWRAEFFLKLKPHLFSWCHRAGALIVIPCSASRSHISRSVKSALSLIHSRNIGSTGARQDFRCPPIWKLCRIPSSRRVLTWYTHTRLNSKRLAISVGRSPCSIAFSTLSRKSCEYACIAYSFRKKTPHHIMNCLVLSQICSNGIAPDGIVDWGRQAGSARCAKQFLRLPSMAGLQSMPLRIGSAPNTRIRRRRSMAAGPGVRGSMNRAASIYVTETKTVGSRPGTKSEPRSRKLDGSWRPSRHSDAGEDWNRP